MMKLDQAVISHCLESRKAQCSACSFFSFILNINKMPSVDPHTQCHLIADDCFLYRIVDSLLYVSLADQLQVQQDLAALEAWAFK